MKNFNWFFIAMVLVWVLLIGGLLAGHFGYFNPTQIQPDALRVAGTSSATSEPIGAFAIKHIGPEFLYPRKDITPGATNPAITQNTIKDNICSK